MSDNRQRHITKAFDELVATTSHGSGSVSETDLVTTMSDMASIAKLVGELAGQARMDLASWATVGEHLRQAQSCADDLARCLSHASGTLAFNSARHAA